MHNSIVRELKVYNEMKNSVDVLDNELSNNDTVDMLTQLNIIVNNKSVELNKKQTTYNNYIADLQTHKTNVEANIKLLCDINNSITDCLNPLCENEKYHIDDDNGKMWMSDDNPIFYELRKYPDIYNKDTALEPANIDAADEINNTDLTTHDSQSIIESYHNKMEFTSYACAIILIINIIKLLY